MEGDTANFGRFTRQTTQKTLNFDILAHVSLMVYKKIYFNISTPIINNEILKLAL